ncbi:MAG: hypothetical protein Q8O89_05675 [Nanoarchaeota archaeon]|nr:hypothetical protein [Nanoarchaeota archaeon]
MEIMKESVKVDILAILDKVLEIMEERDDRDVYEIKELSNHTIHSASIFQDSYSMSIAVLMYSLYKIIERKILDDKNYRNIQDDLKHARTYLRQNDVHNYMISIGSILKSISGIDKRFKVFIQEVVEKAKINKGGKLYEHGLSISKAAELMGLSSWELASYVGKTAFDENYLPGKVTVKKRLSNAMDAFGI